MDDYDSYRSFRRCDQMWLERVLRYTYRIYLNPRVFTSLVSTS